jgi:hypothetical protein
MKQRCLNTNAPNFADYGGRGIEVCERWVDFANFYADMGDPSPGHSLDRYPNNDGNYEPGNCRWADKKQQANNRRKRSIAVWRASTQELIEELQCRISRPLTVLPTKEFLTRHNRFKEAA